MNQDIVDYISAAQKHGLTDFEIKQNLLSAGWEAPLVEQSFSFAKAAEGRSEPGKGAEMLPQQRPQQGVFPNAKPEDFNQPSNSGPKPFQPSKNLSSAVATPMMSDQNFSPQGSQAKKFNVKILAFALVILFVLASGAYGYYAYVYTPPAQNIWGQFLTTKKNPVFKTQFTVAYNDSSAGAASSTQTVSFSFGANAAVDASDPANIKSGGQLTVGANEGIVNFNVQFGYMLLSKVFYLDASNLPEIKNLLPDPSKPWLKIDLDELSNYAKQNLQSLSALSSTTPPQDNKQLNDKLIAIWSKANLVTSADPAAKEKINGTPVYHLTNSINSSALKSAVSDSVDAIENAGGFPAQPDDSIKQALLGLIDKMQVKDFQTWIGQKDHELYKIQMAISMPSVADMSSPTLGDSLPAIGTAKAKSRDAKRLADVRQLASALELYYNDYSGYPAGAGGVPVGGISPNYIGLVPTAPTPSDGSCTDYYNGYWYEPSGKPSSYNGQTVYPSYSLTFCLGSDTGGYKSGIGKLTPQGIVANIACPTTPDKCVNANPSPGPDFQTELDKMSFSAELKLDATFSDFGKAQNLQAPDNATDILNLLNGTAGSPQVQAPPPTTDGTRLQDIRMLSSAFELYFNAKNAYPDSLSQLAPAYIAAVPKPPLNDLGVCSASDANYTYKKISDSNYSLSFCFGQAISGFAAGKHTLSPAGIQ